MLHLQCGKKPRLFGTKSYQDQLVAISVIKSWLLSVYTSSSPTKILYYHLYFEKKNMDTMIPPDQKPHITVASELKVLCIYRITQIRVGFLSKPIWEQFHTDTKPNFFYKQLLKTSWNRQIAVFLTGTWKLCKENRNS